MKVKATEISLFQKTVREHTRYNFDDYSPTSLRRRLARIMMELNMDMVQMAKAMQSDPGFMQKIIGKMTVHTTELFRDPEIWKSIQEQLFPSFRKQDEIKIWHSGCSTGQEVYSMMMLLHSAGLWDKAQIYASDLSASALQKAKRGSYPYRFNQNYPENCDQVLFREKAGREHKGAWRSYFDIDKARDRIQMKDFLRHKPRFRTLDLVRDQNLFGMEFDLIVCRNVIIYFNQLLQNRVFDLYHKNLKPKGALLLGVHESITGPFRDRYVNNAPFYIKEAL
ncbi:MAG: hypothetical protein CSA96_03475 [Bacteroidetes bacterium]|nr:MAG: hypothetical protein CSA96_03475 [Bacteroidota bacterium]